MSGVLGAEFDTIIMQLSLALDKIQRYNSHVEEVLSHYRITLRDLQSIIGKLQYSTLVIHAGKAFLLRLINLTTGVKVPYHYIRLTKGAKLDLVVWKTVLKDFNGLSFLYEPSFAASHTMKMYSDASKKGFGGCYGSKWVQGSWPENRRNYHINILEMYPVMALIEIFGHKFRNSVIKFHCDNSSVVHIVNKQSSKDEVIMVMVRKMALKLLELKTQFIAVHIPGVTNCLSDAISHFQADEGLLQRYPTKIPDHALPQNLIVQ